MMTDNSNDVFEIMLNMRAMRRLKTDPVPDDLIYKILDAGLHAPNSGNTQKYRFMVVKDVEIKKKVQILYQKAFDEHVSANYQSRPTPPGSDEARYHRQHEAVAYLTEHYHEAPVWIVACLEHGDQAPTHMSGASVYPAVQNMLLAARALGLGANLTTRAMRYQKECEQALGLPQGVHCYAILPIGYPMGNFGPTRRGEMNEFVYLDKWGVPFSDK